MTAEEIPTLMVFAISHYCEKARWALDRLGIAYRVRTLPAGVHVPVLKRLGAPATTVPTLVTPGGRVIQGSGEIVDWAEAEHAAGRADGVALTPPAPGIDVAAIETRLGEVTANHARRWYYSEALVSDPAGVRALFQRDLAPGERMLMRLGWPALRQLMIRGLRLDRESGRAAHAVLSGELDWLDGLLAGGRTFADPGSGALGRVDITAAALVAPLAMPAHHPVYHALPRPPLIAGDIAAWADRPIIRWVDRLYETRRAGEGLRAAA